MSFNSLGSFSSSSIRFKARIFAAAARMSVSANSSCCAAFTRELRSSDLLVATIETVRNVFSSLSSAAM